MWAIKVIQLPHLGNVARYLMKVSPLFFFLTCHLSFSPCPKKSKFCISEPGISALILRHSNMFIIGASLILCLFQKEPPFPQKYHAQDI